MRTNLHLGLPRALTPYASWRRRLRFATGGLALANAVVYALIGAGVVAVSDASAGEAASLAAFGAVSAAAFVLGAVLLWATDRRWLWLLGALFQAFVIVAYLGVAPQRTPPYEPWGVALKLAQVLLLVMLAYLAVTAAPARRAPVAAG